VAIVYGLTDQGLVIKNRLVIRDELNAALRLAYGNSISLSDRSILGQLVGIVADRLGELWELLEQVASSQDPDKATGTLLDAICLITGTFRPPALPSVVTLTLTGVDSTVVPQGSEFATTSTLKNFTTTASATLATVPAWTGTHVYVFDDRVANSGNIYQNIQAGTSAGSGGPTGTAPDSTPDGGCLWTFVGLGAAAADVVADSVDLGPIIAVAKDITTIVTSVGGLQGVNNLEGAVLGRLEAEDSELRTLRTAELGGTGSSTFDAIRGQLLQISGVTAVTLFVNNTDSADGDGLPPHSVEALVTGGADQDIYDALLAGVAAGIATHGNTSGTSTDSQGTAQTINFSRATSVPIFVRMTVTTDATGYPLDGDTQIRTRLVDYGAVQSTGRDAVPSALTAQAFRIAGVIDVPQVLVYTDVIAPPVAWAPTTGYVATPGSRSVVTNDGGRAYICITSGTSAGSGGPTGVGSNITDGSAHWAFLGNPVVITTRQHADYLTDNISVSSSPGTP
jgi:hypothetical protein